ncbi:hypothetical protein Tco_0731852 [Tanacetum coccineum]
MVSSPNNNEIEFRISFDESDDEDYTVVFNKNSFSYKIISTNDLKTDLENDNEKVNMPLFPSPEPLVSCIDDLDFFKDFDNEFPAIVYNDALTSKSDFSTEPTLFPQHIGKFDLKDETSLSEYYEVEQNILYFNDLFPFNIIYPDDLKSDKDNDDNEIDMIHSSKGNENTQRSNKLLEESHDKINKVFIMKSFVMELNVNIVAWNYLVNRMLFKLIKNLYVPFGIPFDPKRYYKDGDCTRMLRRPRHGSSTQRSEAPVFNFGGLPDLMAEGLSSRMLMEHRDTQGQSVFTSQAWRRLFDIRGPLVHELILEFFSTFRFGEIVLDLDTRRCRLLVLVYIGLRARGGSPTRGSECLLDQDLVCGGFFRYTPSYTLIRDPILRLCHRLITCSIAGRSQAPEKVTVTDLFYLRGMDIGSVNVPYLLARYLRLFASGRKQGAMISGGLARQEGNTGGVDEEASVAPGGGNEDEEMPQVVPPPPRTQGERIFWLEEEVHGEFETLEDLKVKDVSLTCDTSLEVFNNEFNQLSGMDNDLFTYEVEVANILCDSNKDDDSEQRVSHEVADDMGYDPSDVAFTMLTDEEFSDNEDEVAEVFRIDTNIFDFETPMCKTFNEFNYLLQIDLDLLTKDIEGFKTYKEYKAYIVRDSLNYQVYEWYEALKDSELKEQALRNKAIMEGLISDDESRNDGWRKWESHEITYHDHDELEYENETHDERQELCESHELPVCNMRIFKMIKYSFRQDE